jgi:hypothetical protein
MTDKVFRVLRHDILFAGKIRRGSVTSSAKNTGHAEVVGAPSVSGLVDRRRPFSLGPQPPLLRMSKARSRH